MIVYKKAFLHRKARIAPRSSKASRCPKKTFVVSLLLALMFFAGTIDAGHSEAPLHTGKHPSARDFFVPLTPKEEADIRYIITSLSSKSLFSLLSYRRSLNETGDRVAHVHPLVFLGFIFSDDELKKAVKEIDGITWRRFVKGMGESLEKSAKRDNMEKKYVAEFAKEVGIKETLILPSIQNRKWFEFINVTRDNLP